MRSKGHVAAFVAVGIAVAAAQVALRAGDSVAAIAQTQLVEAAALRRGEPGCSTTG